jgi:hypothetical protein
LQEDSRPSLPADVYGIIDGKTLIDYQEMVMLNRKVIMAVVALAFASMACGITINLPVQQISPGLTKTEEINIPAPEAENVDLSLVFGAGSLKLKPGSKQALVSGTATYNVPAFKPQVKVEGEKVRIETGNLDIHGLPNFNVDEVKNEWDLQLGEQMMQLKINAGAYQGDFDLGGLALKSLEVNEGAADTRLKFSERNKTEMDLLRYITGASSVKLSGLANANFTSMIFRSGAGDYTLDFSGELQRDAVVTVESSFSQVVIIVPEGTSAKVIFKGGLANVDISGNWEKSGDAYIQGSGGPLIFINIDMGAGSLELRTK